MRIFSRQVVMLNSVNMRVKTRSGTETETAEQMFETE